MRIIVIIEDGILDQVIYDDRPSNNEVLLVDKDGHAEEPVIYRRHAIRTDPELVDDLYRAAEKFWEEEG